MTDTPNTTTNTPPLVSTLLGLDYGIKKMGMALGNSLTCDARRFDVLAMNNGQPNWDNLIGIIQVWQIDAVVIGLPLNMDDSDSMLSKRAAKFARRLKHRLLERRSKTFVYLIDERLSSWQARQLAWELGLIDDQKAVIDDVAACLILNSYFQTPSRATQIVFDGMQP